MTLAQLTMPSALGVQEAFKGCGADGGEKNEGEKTPLESRDREGAQETEDRRCELQDSAENMAPPRFACI